jgi:hypothetical protein
MGTLQLDQSDKHAFSGAGDWTLLGRSAIIDLGRHEGTGTLYLQRLDIVVAGCEYKCGPEGIESPLVLLLFCTAALYLMVYLELTQTQ